MKQTNVWKGKKIIILIPNCLKVSYPEKWKHVPTKACSGMFIAALFVTAKKQKQLKWPSTREWINKMCPLHTMEYHYHNKRWVQITSYSADRPRKQYAKWKEPGTKVHILYDSIYIKCLEQTYLYVKKTDLWLPGAGGERSEENGIHC